MSEPTSAEPPVSDEVPGEPSLDELADDLAGVERALERLEDGTYWTDEVTGEPLPDELLAADPTARRAAPRADRPTDEAAPASPRSSPAVWAPARGGGPAAPQDRRGHELADAADVEADGAQRRSLRHDAGQADDHPRRAAGRARRPVRHPHGGRRRQRAGTDEGRADEGRPDGQLHRRGTARRGPTGARRAAGRRRPDGADARRRRDRERARRGAGAGVRRVGGHAGRRGEHRPGPPGPRRRPVASWPSRSSSPASPRRSRRISTPPR